MPTGHHCNPRTLGRVDLATARVDRNPTRRNVDGSTTSVSPSRHRGTLFETRDPSPPPLSYIARSGGLFRDMMIHDFDMARFVLDEEPVAVSAMGSALVDKAIGEAGDIDTAVVIMETKSGKVAQISNSRRATYGYDQRVEAHGDRGMLHAANVRETAVEWAGPHGFTSDKALNFFLERYEAAYRNELDAFVSTVNAGTKPRPDGEDGLKALLLADAAYQSWKTKQRVTIS